MPRITTISFDGEDTLWSIQPVRASVEERFLDLLKRYAPADVIRAQLRAEEERNARRFGHGANGFVLSLIELAIEASRGAISAAEIGTILRFIDDIADGAVTLVEGARATLSTLALEYTLILHATGDLLELEKRIARSGLADFFDHVRIVSSKDERAFARLLSRTGVSPGQLVTVGRSLTSDILPALARGSHAIQISGGPGAECSRGGGAHGGPEDSPRYRRARQISDLPQIIGLINAEIG